MISIIICTYNRVEKLKLVIEDILGDQSNDSINYELLVVDNNSQDSTKEYIGEFTKQFPQKVRYLFEEKQGLSNARNCGIKEARGKWICFTDDDVRLDNNWLTAIASAIKYYPQMAAYGGRIKPKWIADPPEWFIREGKYAMGGGAIVSRDLGDTVCNMNERKVCPIGANMGFRNDVFDKVGLFHPDFGKKGDAHGLGDDVEFCRRVKDAGYEILYLPDSIVWHEVDVDRLQVPILKQFYFELGYFRGRERMFPEQAVWLFGAPRYLFKELPSSLLRSLGLRFISQGKSYYYLFMYHYVRGLLKGCYEKQK